MTLRATTLLALVLAASTAALPASAAPGRPTFEAAIYADGEAFGTKDAADLPAPTGANAHSFDTILVFANGADGQLPVAEAAPGNPAFNGGRWAARQATWTAAGLAAHPDLPVLTSYEEVLLQVGLGHLAIGHEVLRYFECPLLPVR